MTDYDERRRTDTKLTLLRARKQLRIGETYIVDLPDYRGLAPSIFHGYIALTDGTGEKIGEMEAWFSYGFFVLPVPHESEAVEGLEILRLSRRVHVALLRAGIHTVSTLAQRGSRLLELDHIGEKGYAEIMAALQEYGSMIPPKREPEPRFHGLRSRVRRGQPS